MSAMESGGAALRAGAGRALGQRGARASRLGAGGGEAMGLDGCYGRWPMFFQIGPPKNGSPLLEKQPVNV